MQISIDTSRDSKEDIIKAIHLLHSIIGENHQTSTASRNIFDNPSPELPIQQIQPAAQSAFSSFFDNMNKPQIVQAKKESVSRVELY